MTTSFDGLRLGLGALPLRSAARTRSISAENPTGAKGAGGRADPSEEGLPFARPASRLGRGWKVSPFIKPKAGETCTLADVDGPGVIQHIWMTTEPSHGRDMVLRFYWDGEPEPSIEVPLGDFFAVGHNKFAPVNSLPVVANHAFGLNCYWPMPFRQHARITLTNDGETDARLFAYQITYVESEVPDDALYLHAQWRRSVPPADNAVHTIVDGVTGPGHYVGTFLAYTSLHEQWYGEGEVKFYLDGDDEYPTICGTGTEDYFGAAFGFPQLYSTPFLGCTLDYPTRMGVDTVPPHAAFDPLNTLMVQNPGPQKLSLYRWHVLDPVNFGTDLKVTIQALGWYHPTGYYRPLPDDLATVAYWYQGEPHTSFPALPDLAGRWPR
jgi:hypothetical protein